MKKVLLFIILSSILSSCYDEKEDFERESNITVVHNGDTIHRDGGRN